MVMQKYLYTKCPSEGPGTQLSIHEILEEIQKGKVSLMSIFWANSFQHYYAFQIPLVHKWMLSILFPYMNSIAFPQIPFSNFNAQEKNWYIYREEKDNLFGPLSIAEVLKMKKKDYIFESDFCFSIKDDSFFYARELPEIQILPKEKDQPFFFQRRSRRFNELHDCDVHITFKNIQTPVKLIDFSENGAAIYCPIDLPIDDSVEITINLIDPISKQVKIFTHKAIIKSMKKDANKIRYGLFLLDKANQTLVQIKNEKKAA